MARSGSSKGSSRLRFDDIYRLLRRYDDAISAFEYALELSPQSIFIHLRVAYTYSEAGRDEDARLAAAEVLKSNPNFSLELVPKAIPFKDPAELTRILKSLEKAGIP